MIKPITLIALVSILLTACASQPAQKTPNGFGNAVPNQIGAPQNGNNPSQTNANPAQPAAQLQVILVPSEIFVGPNRFAVGLIDPKLGMIDEATVHFRYFDLSNPAKPTVESEADAVRLHVPDDESTIFAQERDFKRAGAWGVEVQAKLADNSTITKRISFSVVAKSSTLKPGAVVPALATRTLKDVGGDIQKISSALQPNPELYRASLAQAITNGKPTVLLFATPAFCQTRLCGPSYEIVSALQQIYGDAVNFIHIEVYSGLPNPTVNNWQIDPAMTAFGIETEPWVFMIGKTGTITYRVEGMFTQDEIERHLKPLLSQ